MRAGVLVPQRNGREDNELTYDSTPNEILPLHLLWSFP